MARIAKQFTCNFTESFCQSQHSITKEINNREERYGLKGCKVVSKLDSFSEMNFF